jgi:cytochrome P450
MVRRTASRIVKAVPTIKEADMTAIESAHTDHADIAWYCPIALVCAALGVPRRDWRFFSRWAADASSQKAFDELCAYLDVMIANRCSRPANDLLSHLIQIDAYGEELTVDDIHMLVAALVAGSRSDEMGSRRP